MNETSGNMCLAAFNKLCEELSVSNLASLEECQYWMFERGYKAALDEMVNNISIASKASSAVSLEKKYLAKKEVAYH
jgi:hypothetical protein